MANEFDRCNAVTLSYEGGNDDDPRDPGGRTSRGITQREWAAYLRTHSGSSYSADVWRAPQSAIVDIYRTQYWNPVDGDQWPAGVDLCVYDAAVNSGAGKSLSWARSALAQRTGTFVSLAAAASAARSKVEIIHRYQARRLSFLEALRTWAYFGKGWGRRVAGIESIATKWALQATGLPPEIVKAALEKKANSAGASSKAAGTGAISAPAVPSSHALIVDHHSWYVYAVDAVLIAATLWLVACLLHKWYVHWMQAISYRGAFREL